MSSERLRVAAVSLLATWLFFLEYLPPFKQVHFPYDIESYHYPLLDYAYQSLREGRLPEWDPALYCGLSFVGNVQAAFFYPPNWLLFAANLGRARLSFLSLEALVIAHVWLAFFLCYLWLRGRRLGLLPSVLGGAVFAYSGYMVSQIQHVGVVTGYAWMPLGLWGIDQADGGRRLRALWKPVAASTLCFLAGYPPAWLASCVCLLVYAAACPGRWRAAMATGASLAASLAVVMVQLLPALESAALKSAEKKYGGGIQGSEFYLAYFLPNYFDLGLQSRGTADPTSQYIYLGAPVFFGLVWMLRSRRLRGQLPALAIAGLSLLAMTNPLGLVEALVDRAGWLSEICRDWNFLAGLSLAAALLAAVGVDESLQRASPLAPGWLTPITIAALGVWSARQVSVWLPGGAEFASGWASAVESSTVLAGFALAVFLLRAERGARRAALTTAVLLAVGVDYKVFGTSRRFNAGQGEVDPLYAGVPFRGMHDSVYEQLRANPGFRLALDETDPFVTALRHFGLSTPQGFDPLLPVQYKKAIEAHIPFRTDRLFYIPPANEVLLRRLGVRYFLTTESGPAYPSLVSNSSFRLLEPAQTHFRVFEFLRARPAFHWEQDGETPASVELKRWAPEQREFLARSSAGGRFVLVEQFFPGWRASVDGRPVPIERWGEAFQAIPVEAGEHRIQFEFRSRGLRVGAVVTAISLLAWMGIAIGMRTPSRR